MAQTKMWRQLAPTRNPKTDHSMETQGAFVRFWPLCPALGPPQSRRVGEIRHGKPAADLPVHSLLCAACPPVVEEVEGVVVFYDGIWEWGLAFIYGTSHEPSRFDRGKNTLPCAAWGILAASENSVQQGLV